MKMVRQARAKNSNLAGPRDVDQVWFEAIQRFVDERNVPKENRIEAQIFFKHERKKAARQLQRPYVALFRDCLSAVACAYTEKRKIAPPRKALKMAAGVGDPVDFVKRVGKVRDARDRPGRCDRRWSYTV
jgi:hypothetical protein